MPTVVLAPGTPSIILPLPTSTKEFTFLERIKPPGDGKPLARFAPGVLVKFACDYEAEVRALQFVHGKLSVRTPRVLHHAPFPKARITEPMWTTENVWYFDMDECTGVPLDTVIGSMSPTELDHIADQLRVVLDEMHSYKSTTLGSATGDPYDNFFMPYPWSFSSVKEYFDYYRSVFLEFCGPEYVDELFSCFPTEAQVCFTHGDLLPHNILVDGSKITAIVDWETAGYYPEFLEYCRMHDLGRMTPGWTHVLARIFPGPRPEKQIKAVRKIINLILRNSIYD